MSLLDTHPLRGAFLAAILEELGALIVRQGEDLLADGGLTFPPRAASTILLLGDRGPMSAADLAKALDQPHQLVTQRVDLLIDRELVLRAEDPGDARRRILSLTPDGVRQACVLNARLVQAQAAFAALYAEIGCDLADAARAATAALQRAPLLDRVRAAATPSPDTRSPPPNPSPET